MRRPILHRLLAERSGHGDFADYHDRFGHTGRYFCLCGKLRMPGHFIRCYRTAKYRPAWLRPGLETEDILGNDGWKAFEDLVTQSQVYDHADDEDDDESVGTETCVLDWLQEQSPIQRG